MVGYLDCWNRLAPAAEGDDGVYQPLALALEYVYVEVDPSCLIANLGHTQFFSPTSLSKSQLFGSQSGGYIDFRRTFRTKLLLFVGKFGS